jgi:hypothetical protein
VHDQVDPGKRAPEVRGGVVRLRDAGLRVRAVQVPVAVHLGEGADVDLLAPRVDRVVERDQVPVARALRDLMRRDRLLAVLAACREADHRHLAERREEIRERGAPAGALVPADDRVADGRDLAGLRLEARHRALDPEDRRSRGGGRYDKDGDDGGEKRSHRHIVTPSRELSSTRSQRSEPRSPRATRSRATAGAAFEPARTRACRGFRPRARRCDRPTRSPTR